MSVLTDWKGGSRLLFGLALLVGYSFTVQSAAAAPISVPQTNIKHSGVNVNVDIVRVGRRGGGMRGMRGGGMRGMRRGGMRGMRRGGMRGMRRGMTRRNFSPRRAMRMRGIGPGNVRPMSRRSIRARNFSRSGYRVNRRALKAKRFNRRKYRNARLRPAPRRGFKAAKRYKKKKYRAAKRAHRRYTGVYKHRGKTYRRARHRNKYYRYFYKDWYYAYPWWRYGSYVAYSGYSDAHVDWCLDHHRAYNPRTNIYIGYDGVPRQCVSPYYNPYY